jgi:hypothetical protein
LEKEGVIQRFEYCFELAWKCVKDYLEEGGIVFPTVTPGQVLKTRLPPRFSRTDKSGLTCSTTAIGFRTPTISRFEKAVESIHTRYLAAIEQLHDYLQNESLN